MSQDRATQVMLTALVVGTISTLYMLYDSGYAKSSQGALVHWLEFALTVICAVVFVIFLSIYVAKNESNLISGRLKQWDPRVEIVFVNTDQDPTQAEVRLGNCPSVILSITRDQSAKMTVTGAGPAITTAEGFRAAMDATCELPP